MKTATSMAEPPDDDPNRRALYYEILRRLARGRVPPGVDEDDLALRAMRKADALLGRFPPGEGAIPTYMLRIIMNRVILDAWRAAGPHVPGFPDTRPTPEDWQRYYQALEKLSEDHRVTVILRLEMWYTYEEIAEAVGLPSADAARMVTARALLRLAQEMAAPPAEDG